MYITTVQLQQQKSLIMPAHDWFKVLHPGILHGVDLRQVLINARFNAIVEFHYCHSP